MWLSWHGHHFELPGVSKEGLWITLWMIGLEHVPETVLETVLERRT
jgi:hypothetical protein